MSTTDLSLSSRLDRRYLQAVLFALTAMFCFSVLGAMIKVGSDFMHPLQLAFFRIAFALLLLLPFTWRRLPAALGEDGMARLYLWRGLAGAAAMLLGFWSLRYLPLADSTAINFTAPLFVTVGAALILGETVRRRRWTATLIGFVGMLIVVRPGTDALSIGAMMALASALFMAAAVLILKRLSRTQSPDVMTTMMALYITPITLIPALLVWQTPTWFDIGYGLALALVGTIGHLAWTRALKMADVSAVMPFEFAKLPFAAAFGFILFTDIPDIWVLIGGTIIASSGLYIAHREAVLKAPRERLGSKY